MDFDIIRQSSETILSNWGGLPIAYDNVEFDSTAQDNWVRITVLDGDSFNTSLGGKCVRKTGIIVIQLFTKQWQGSAYARNKAGELAALFTNVLDSSIVYDVAAVTRVGHDNDYYQMNINIPFQLDEVLP